MKSLDSTNDDGGQVQFDEFVELDEAAMAKAIAKLEVADKKKALKVAQTLEKVAMKEHKKQKCPTEKAFTQAT